MAVMPKLADAMYGCGGFRISLIDKNNKGIMESDPDSPKSWTGFSSYFDKNVIMEVRNYQRGWAQFKLWMEVQK